MISSVTVIFLSDLLGRSRVMPQLPIIMVRRSLAAPQG